MPLDTVPRETRAPGASTALPECTTIQQRGHQLGFGPFVFLADVQGTDGKMMGYVGNS